MESRPLRELIERVTAEPRVWIRLAASKPDADWQLSLLEVTLGEAPHGWRRQRWQYPNAAFIASAPSGKTVAGWLVRRRVSLRPVSLRLDPSDPVHVDWRESRAAGILEALPWPTHVWNVERNGQSTQPPHAELVAADAPAFFSFDQAAAAFFALPPPPNRNYSGRELIVRDQDRRARIDSVRVRPTEVLATVSGLALGGAQLTLGGDRGSTRRLSPRIHEVRLPLDPALASGAWLALHRDQELLDRRILDPSWGARDIDVEIDASTRVELLISGGENASTEFKAQLPSDDAQQVMKTVAAFANGGGGTIVFGVDDEGRAVGLSHGHARAGLDRLTNLVTDWVRPLVDFNLELVEFNGREMVVVDVKAGANTPYGVGTTDRKVAYYIRRGATTFPAAPAEVRAFVRSRVPVAAQPPTPLVHRRR